MTDGRNPSRAELAQVGEYFKDLQSRVCAMVESVESTVPFVSDPQPHPGGGLSYPMVLSGGAVVEKAAVNFSHSIGAQLPAAATTRRPEFSGCGFEAMAISLIIHPVNPHVPTTHANLRVFAIKEGESIRDWWFGGGFDLTPYYGYAADCVHWHRTAKAACTPFGEGIYEELKAECDRYFFLPHRDEPRGIGGLFFDDWKRGGWSESFRFVESVGDHFLLAYEPLLQSRKAQPYTDEERAFQIYRRGRYVEFNLVYDRGTKYGLQSGKRTETVMASMPPLVSWHYKYAPDKSSREARFIDEFLTPRDWLAGRGTD
ncbi:MAG: oxygen-dependent coproporphyrinogen oxidase [Myxococcota bacterium]|nr:oxygen-dependent coproporphyrinogen oxidase [Myxococcota bacterium]